MSNNVEYVIKLIDDFSKTSAAFNKQISSMDTAYNKISTKRVRSPFDDQNRSISQLKTNIDRYKKASESSFRTDHILKYNRLIEKTEDKIKSLTKSTQTYGEKSKGVFDKLQSNFGISKSMLGFGALIGVGVGGLDYGKDAILAAAQVEKYNVTLKTMLGSKGAARGRMTEYSDIAKSTPFELNQVVEAGNQLQAIGRYSKANLIQLGDLGAAAGKPIEQVMTAYAKLSTGQKGEGVNMFRDLLISTDDWIKATGKGIGKNGELIATTEEMIAALPKIMKSKGFSGMMEQQAKTTEGQISNLKDSFFGLKVAVGEKLKPAFDSALGRMQKIVATATEWVAVPTAQKIAEEKAQLNSLVGIITDANTGEAERKRMLLELKAEYPEFLANIDLETVKNGELLTKLDDVNKAYETKMRYAAMKDYVTKEEKDLQDLYNTRARYQTFVRAKVDLGELQDFFKQKYGIYEDVSQKDGLIRKSRLTKKNAEMTSRYAKNPKDNEASEFIYKYSLFEAQKKIVQDNKKWSESNNPTVFARYMKENLDAIKTQENVVDIYKKNLTGVERESLYEQAKGINIKDENTYNRLFNDKKLAAEFDAIRSKAFKDITTDKEWERLSEFLGGGAKKTGNLIIPGTGNIDKATDAITGGGKQIKQIIINIDNLVGVNNNNFNKGDDPKDATSFMDKLTNALTMIVNDTNYATN